MEGQYTPEFVPVKVEVEELNNTSAKESPLSLPVTVKVERGDFENDMKNEDMSKFRRSQRVTGRQLEMLWQFLNAHRDIASAFNRSLQAKEYSQRKWRGFAEKLNAQRGGSRKDGKGWCKYWVDYKAKLKGRVAALRSTQRRTGGGPSTDKSLTDIEEKFLQILGDDFCQGLSGVRADPFTEPQESGAAVVESDVQDFDSILANFNSNPPVPMSVALPSQSPSRPPSPSSTKPPSPSQPSTRPPSQPLPPATPPAAPSPRLRSPRRRALRRRREHPLALEATRRALLKDSQLRAEASVKNRNALERIADAMQGMQSSLTRIERYSESCPVPVTVKVEPQDVNDQNDLGSTEDSNIYSESCPVPITVKVDPQDVNDQDDLGNTEDSNIYSESCPVPVTVKVEPQDVNDQNNLGSTEDSNMFQQKSGSIEREPISEAVKYTSIKIEIKQEPVEYDSNDTISTPNDTTQKPTVALINEKINTLLAQNNSNFEHRQPASEVGHRCTLCKQTFNTERELQRHLTKHINRIKQVHDSKLTCHHCIQQYDTQEELKRHILTHSPFKKKPYECENCHTKFTTPNTLRAHVRNKICVDRPLKSPYTCQHCNRVFDRKIVFHSHLRVHSNTDRPFTCDTCNESFKYRPSLIKHQKIHMGVPQVQCPVCQKVFADKGALTPHMRLHTGEKPYACPICDKRFTLKHTAKKHLITHKREKVLVCEICQKRFPRESRLKYHMKTHSKEKPYSCDICKCNFSHKQNVLRHLYRKHPHTVPEEQKVVRPASSVVRLKPPMTATERARRYRERKRLEKSMALSGQGGSDVIVLC